MLRVLTIPVNGVYFDQIKAGVKPEEYRLVTPFWSKRLVGRTYDQITLTRGYPKADDAVRRLTLPWRGYAIKTITHPHFGPAPVEVFAIAVPTLSASAPDQSGSAGTDAAQVAGEGSRDDPHD